jgi:hypothetical protein
MRSLHPSVKLWILARNAPIALNLGGEKGRLYEGWFLNYGGISR